VSDRRHVETLIIGGGQAGLSVSWQLTQKGRSHVVLEKARVGETWRRKWDSFRLLTPNWSVQLAGFPYAGDDPDGFIARDEVVAHLEAYAASFNAPVESGVDVTAVDEHEDGFRATTSAGTIFAKNVVVATGAFPVPNIPAYATNVPPGIVAIHSVDYRNPDSVPAGAVFVVGSAQSGFQIADELRRAGRDVMLSVGACGWTPRRYRGRDVHAWLADLGFLDHQVEVLPNLEARFACTPNLITRSERLTTFRDLQTQGIELVGHLEKIENGLAHTGGGVEASLQRADKVSTDVKKLIDDYIARAGIEAPTEVAPPFGPAAASDGPRAIDLVARGIRSIVWATGFRHDFSWIHEEVFDTKGYPLHTRGVTTTPGLFFIGLPWLHKRKSSLLFGAAEDAAYIADRILERVPATP
jgi:putative flavoprotein involved in K+ transport